MMCFSLWVEIKIVLVWGSKLTCFCPGIVIDVFSVWGPKMTWFWCLDENWLGLCGGSNFTWF